MKVKNIGLTIGQKAFRSRDHDYYDMYVSCLLLFVYVDVLVNVVYHEREHALADMLPFVIRLTCFLRNIHTFGGISLFFSVIYFGLRYFPYKYIPM